MMAKPTYRYFVKEWKWLMQEIARAWDVAVLRTNLAYILPANFIISWHESLNIFMSYLDDLGHQAGTQLKSVIESTRYHDLKERSLKITQELQSLSIGANQSPTDYAESHWNAQYATIQFLSTIASLRFDTLRMDELHTIRIEFKKFRYTLEVFQSILPEVPRKLSQHLEELQETFGAFTDVVFCQQWLQEHWDTLQNSGPYFTLFWKNLTQKSPLFAAKFKHC